jgi:hypothetical protein
LYRLQLRKQPAEAVQEWGPFLAGLSILAWAISLLAGFNVGLEILSIAGLVASLAGFSRPSVGLLGVGLLATLDPATRSFLMSGGILRSNTFNYLLLAATVLFLPMLLKRSGTPALILQVLLALLLVQLVFSSDVAAGMQQVLNAAACLGLMVYFHRAGDDSRSWYWMAVVSGVAAAFAGLVYYQQGDIDLMNANAWAMVPLTAVLTICLACASGLNSRQLRLLLPVAAINLAWIFLSGSRGTLLAALPPGIYLLWELPRASQRVLTVAVLGASAVLSLILFPELVGRTTKRIERLVDSRYSVANRTSGRADLAQAGFRMFLEHPTGIGTGGFAAAFQRLEGEPISFEGEYKQAHSGWVKVAVENGVPGLALLTMFLGSFSWVTRRAPSRLRRFGAMVTVTLVLALISNEFQSKGLWLLAAAASVRLYSEHASISLRDLPPGRRRWAA